jgi:hypothetical protein
VYSREIDEEIITLAPSGWTYGENPSTSVFVLYDKETESLWFPADGGVCTLPAEEIENADCGLVGIGGEYAGRSLIGLYTLERTTWAQWKTKFPETNFVGE